MSTIQQRPRRWSSRLNNVAANPIPSSTTQATGPTTNMVAPNQGFDPINYANYNNTDNRIIYETANVVLRPLPFYDLISDIIRPAGLMSDGVPGRLNESLVEFRLTIEQADMVAMSVDSKQIILRFCNYDTAGEQDDNFPPEAVVTVNGSNILLPPAISNPNKPLVPPKRPGQHVDITRSCKLCPYVQNIIHIKWMVDPTEPNRSYVVSVILGEKQSAETLLQRIKDRGPIDAESSKRLIVDSDNEVATMNLQSSLVCPLGKMRMTMPCKATTCQHIPCFDAQFYLQMNEKKASWICPVCYKPAYYRDLKIDGWFMDILKNTDTSVTEVTLQLDGTYSPVMKTEQQASESHQPEIITISDDDDE